MPLYSESIEYGVITLLIVLQIGIAFALYIKIQSYKNIFKNAPEVKSKYTTTERLDSGNIRSILYQNEEEETEDLVQISYLDEATNNKIMKNIVEPINNYLVKNKGIAIDFHILKDIIDRNVEIEEDDISNRVPAPLYIGLSATMLGIIFGLFSMNFNLEKDASEMAIQAMEPLINGIKIAMTASVVGLILTTLFSVSIFKNAKAKVEAGKNKFLSIIQSELMPKMNKSKLPEVNLLAQKLDVFSRETNDVVSKLGKIISNSEDSVRREQDLISDLRELDVHKVSAINLNIFNQLEGMMSTFNNFAKYYEHLDKSLLNTTKLVDNLSKFVSSTENINDVLEDLKRIISRSDQSTEFFNQHIKSFSQYSEAVNESVADSDSKMSKAIEHLGKTVQKQFESFNEIVAEYDVKLSTSFDHSIEKFNETMKVQADKTVMAFNDSRPKFEKLEQLDKLNVIEQRLEQLESGIVTALKNNNNQLIHAIENSQTTAYVTNTAIPETISKDTPELENSIFQKIILGLKITSYVVVIIAGIIICYEILF